MPTFYGMNLRNEWRMMALGAIVVFALGNLFLSVYPLMQANRETVIRETMRRAQFMAKQIADKNAPVLAVGAESKTDVAGVDQGDGVRAAYLTDIDLRILAPARAMNQYLAAGGEAIHARRAAQKFKMGFERGYLAESDNSTVVAVEPVRVFVPSAGRNLTIGLAVVSIDTSLVVADFGEMGLVYGETLILTGILAFLVFFVLYRVTLKPLEVLGEDMDKALKGEVAQVTQEFQFEELKPLFDLVNSAISRAARAGASGAAGGGSAAELTAEDVIGPFKLLGQNTPTAVVVCDSSKRVVHMSALFEEISGIRADSAGGQELTQLARDQAFSSIVQDLLIRAVPGADGVSEDFEFSGTQFKLHASAIGTISGSIKAYVILAVKGETG